MCVAFNFSSYKKMKDPTEHNFVQKYKINNSGTLPQNSQKYLACWDTSIFLICFLKLAPYLVPIC